MSTPRLKSMAEERRLFCCALVNNSACEMEIHFSCLQMVGCIWRNALFKALRKRDTHDRLRCAEKQRQGYIFIEITECLPT